MAAWYISRVGYVLCQQDRVLPLRVLHGRALPDGHVYAVAKTADTLKSKHAVDDPGHISGLRRGTCRVHVHGLCQEPFRWRSRRRPRSTAAARCGTYLLGGAAHAEAHHDLRGRAGDHVDLERLSAARTWCSTERTILTIPIHIQYLKGSYGTVDLGATMALIHAVASSRSSCSI